MKKKATPKSYANGVTFTFENTVEMLRQKSYANGVTFWCERMLHQWRNILPRPPHKDQNGTSLAPVFGECFRLRYIKRIKDGFSMLPSGK